MRSHYSISRIANEAVRTNFGPDERIRSTQQDAPPPEGADAAFEGREGDSPRGVRSGARADAGDVERRAASLTRCTSNAGTQAAQRQQKNGWEQGGQQQCLRTFYRCGHGSTGDAVGFRRAV